MELERTILASVWGARALNPLPGKEITRQFFFTNLVGICIFKCVAQEDTDSNEKSKIHSVTQNMALKKAKNLIKIAPLPSLI